ncbi:AaceriADR360Wp [[Ashbya] aceris (nom. inval.)]|nr:AaceriADR360Wp [[Ashbya] aceris (nom. inval.)]
MFARAAAIASVPAMREGTALDAIDSRIIHCKGALARLKELERVVKLLTDSMAGNTASRTIIPLTSYVLALCQGPLFGLSATLRKRYELLSQMRLVKLTEVTAAASSGPVDLWSRWPADDEDADSVKNKFYDEELHGRILEHLLHTTRNCYSLYQKRYKLLLAERDACRTGETQEWNDLYSLAVDDFIAPSEITLGLELAVLITDRDTDTADMAYQKLNIQVLSKLLEYFNSVAMPTINQYYAELQRAVRNKGMNQNNILTSLPFWAHTLHRIFAMLLRAKYLLDIIQSVLRLAYLPNKIHLSHPTVHLASPNLYLFRNTLERLDEICCGSTVLSARVTEYISPFLQQGVTHRLTYDKVVHLYKEAVRPTVSSLTEAIELMSNLVKTWEESCSQDHISRLQTLSANGGNILDAVEQKFLTDKSLYEEDQKRKEELKRSSAANSNSTKQNGSPQRRPSNRSATNTNSPLRQQALANGEKRVSTAPLVRRRSLSLQRGSPSPDFDNSKRSNSLQFDSSTNQMLLQSSVREALSRYRSRRANTERPLSTPPGAFPYNTFASSMVDEESRHIARLSLTDGNMPAARKATNMILEYEDTSRESSITGYCNYQTDANQVLAGPHLSASFSSVPPIKKVRFIGVPPPTEDEDPKPKRKGWYKKPAVLHYPTPSQSMIQKNKLRHEGYVFRTSLREQQREKHQQPGRRFAAFLDHVKDTNTLSNQKAAKIKAKLTR